ncbi:MAG: cupin domain-containing protein [SAR202 cluster bacterium]|jgi:mannose-6-phosphate isomerase-like protein (cupin superfamily)|nr:cupin domain-containing protein [SAR202 cluster bacterium]MDP6662596.1 cupin domain-containing protein [SAR202 cluster bacterium]MQG56817.1 cupin domain-containing protein [SAR202 cluster bacterium]MQG68032.1 cupin domain-containing protein [SAR202 cluster bacterium]HAL46526.1 cupin domain-containing protein [Dehalococcoidia bacterium]|tara:strand:+ start:6429 stop:6974 length:546 start_codon:yes stop_codon:yes gene_type:complete
MADQYRRVVTGFDENGRSIVAIDGPPGPEDARGTLLEMWATDSTPADNSIPGDAADRPVRLEPSAEGSKFRFFRVAPESTLPSFEERNAQQAARLDTMNEDDRADAVRIRRDTTRHPGMHETLTVDYIILLSGEVTMLLDEDQVDLKPFDVVVQRGTNHAWVNHGTETAVLAAVLIDADPL